MFRTIGWDIGGAHLKAVLLEDGKVVRVTQISCELWRGLDKLEAAINKVLATFDAKDARHAVTMTGELVDLFMNRREGVLAISTLASHLLGKQAQFYTAGDGFIGIEGVFTHAERIASANWHASASLLAKYVKNALFVDVGSTTTDIVPIVDGKVKLDASSDAQRMANDTLIYTGVVRTPVMALAQKLPFDGAKTNVAAEYFATMADVYRLTGNLLPKNDMTETADGKGKTVLESARRLARMVGHDVENRSLEAWITLAEACKNLQIAQIKMAASKHLLPSMSIMGAGAGVFLVNAVADQLRVSSLTIADVLKMDLNDELSLCFPAYAVARLAWLEGVSK
jgi:(4-(4-[2-(gamma-L-glutamylamino)ethyl]phenoxymethyl)furan-2-yl)methanamine synthase